MPSPINLNLNYENPIKIAEGIYWVGFCDEESGLHCNPYLIVDGDEAVVIDGGSRPDFPTVMTKILKTGTDPSDIRALIYHHYDPDLCGSVSDYEDIIERDDLRIMSTLENNFFIRHYGPSSALVDIAEYNDRFTFSSGRTLAFIRTPYAHSAGSFITYDELSGVVFTSDLFGSYGREWELFIIFDDLCKNCTPSDPCPHDKPYCPMDDILTFHKMIMPSGKALRHAAKQILGTPAGMAAPQHGSVIPVEGDFRTIGSRLLSLADVGIDRIVKEEGDT
ncbi:MBL fold metallo-hydrolase [Desulfoluna limicola]|uniref:MBL fold metallo-hydrolase n=1 Tax=Desulfoluna limicola TaxID=2810562 RepID=A0ABM7PJM9_9BACT|nr:MBL fold metallo-hydrolase [Desulfoluna limicola]BCS97390.1 MBL fold metallo-hydrolase [Desulfoluna limicola]